MRWLLLLFARTRRKPSASTRALHNAKVYTRVRPFRAITRTELFAQGLRNPRDFPKKRREREDKKKRLSRISTSLSSISREIKPPLASFLIAQRITRAIFSAVALLCPVHFFTYAETGVSLLFFFLHCLTKMVGRDRVYNALNICFTQCMENFKHTHLFNINFFLDIYIPTIKLCMINGEKKIVKTLQTFEPLCKYA